jgi:hypothetical protein
MNKKSKVGDNGGVVEYHTMSVPENAVKFFGVSDKIDTSEGIDTETLIECSHCKSLLSWDNFVWVLKGTKYTIKKTLNSRTCKSCTSKNSKVLRDIKKQNPPPPKGTHCAIEGCNNTDLHCDHNHVTGVFRGYICTQHNTGLGKMGDSMVELIKGIEYLMATSKDSDGVEEAKMLLMELIK